jgi:hypothetical protein
MHDDPQDRLERLAAIARDAIKDHPEYDDDTDRFIIAVSDEDRSGLFLNGYDGPAPVIVDLLEHAQGTIEAVDGGTMEFLNPGKDDDTLTVKIRFHKQDKAHRAQYEVPDGAIRAAIIVAFIPKHAG